MVSNNDGITRIGTSGIILPGNKSHFPDEYKSGTRLHYYGSLFNTLEVNSSFYKIPLPSTFTKWGNEVPEDFTFTVKLWKGITHVDNLSYRESDIEIFMHSVSGVENKAACILIQFPPSVHARQLDKVESLIQSIRLFDKSQRWRLVVEFRRDNWYQDATYTMLENNNVALAIHDMPGSQTPLDYQSSEVIYYRFHGPTGHYTDSYGAEDIQRHAARIKALKKTGKDVYVYFNNTIGGAFENAQSLQNFIL